MCCAVRVVGCWRLVVDVYRLWLCVVCSVFRVLCLVWCVLCGCVLLDGCVLLLFVV